MIIAFSILGSTIDEAASTRNKLKSGFLVCSLVYAVFCCTTGFFATPLVKAMSQNASQIDITGD